MKIKRYYELSKGLERFFVQQRALENQVKKAEVALNKRNNDLRKFNEDIKKEIIRELSSGQTTGDPLTDEIVRWFGLDKNSIEETSAFNKNLTKGKEILIAVSRQECTKHVFVPTPGCENEYTTLTGYIYGIPSGENLVIKSKSKKHPTGVEIILPLKRYIKWDFAQDNTSTPVEGPLIVDGNVFNDISVLKLLSTISTVGSTPSLETTLFRKSSGFQPDIRIVIDGKIPGEKNTSGYGELLMALDHGREEINSATPSEEIAGANI